jgi:hypothetical protein
MTVPSYHPLIMGASQPTNSAICYLGRTGIPVLELCSRVKAKLFFDLSDLLAEPRLGDAQSLRSAREVKIVGQYNDRLQVTHFNVGEHR